MKHGYARISKFLYKGLCRLPLPLQQMIITVMTRMQEPKPESSSDSPQEAGQQGLATWGWVPMLALMNAWGLLSVVYADISSRYTTTDMSIFFWLGLLFIFVPSTVRLLSPKASRFERISILCIVGICFYLVKVMYSPLYFSYYDEFLHWRTADDIAKSGHLFGENALLPISPDYPGLEIVTNAFSTLSGLTIFQAGVIIIAVARLVMVLSLFMLAELVMKSARMAGITTILYMTNPHFLFFDGQFGYESLALPIATFMLFVLAYVEMCALLPTHLKQIATLKSLVAASGKQLNNNLRWAILLVWGILGAVVVTHHVTDFIFDGFLVLWAVIYIFLHRASILRSNLVRTALFAVFISTVYVIFIANPVGRYLSSFLVGTLNELGHILRGSSGARQLFVDYGGEPIPIWQRITSLLSLAFIVFPLPLGGLCLWLRYRSNTLACMFGIVSLLYPISQVFRFTSSGDQLSDRTAAFLFIPLSCVLAIFITQLWPTRWLTWKQTVLIACALSIVLLGQVIVGAGPAWAILPGGPYLVSADAHSIEPEGIETALWTRSYLGPSNRVAADRINQLLMGTYGEQRDITGIEDNIEVAPVFLSTTLGPNEVAILRSAKIRYLVVDLRFASALPRLGFYFDSGEPGAYHYTAPIDQEALTKFAAIPQINRVFDSGDIIIYDVGGLTNAPQKP